MVGVFEDKLGRWLDAGGREVLDALLCEAPDVIGIMDLGFTVRYVNWAIAGLERDHIIGGSVFDLVPPGYKEHARETYTQVIRSGRATRFETLYRDGDQLLVWDVRVGPIRAEGAIVGLIAITSDVTETRHAHADRDRFFSLSLDMLVVASADGRLRRLNPAFGETLGYGADELLTIPFLDLVHPDDVEATRKSHNDVLAGRRVVDFENRYRCRDGRYRVFSWRATVDPITGDTYSVARDVTQVRATENQLRQAQKMEAIGQLAGGIAHDFNNLLLAIMGNAQLASHIATTPELSDHLEEILAASKRAADLTRQLLVFSKRSRLNAVPVQLAEVVQDMIKLLRRLVPESISIDVIGGHELATVNADPSQLEQVILNLCVNARDAMEHGGRLTIETENVLVNGRFCEAHPWAKPGRYVLLSVTDTGVGMTAEVRERVFEPFFTTKGQAGTGLGLATVYGIVEQHGGMIHVYSEPGVGSTFKVYFPAVARLATAVGDKLEMAPPRGRETILVAEDEELVRCVVVRILEHAGYRVLPTANGREAIRRLSEGEDEVHLALVDLVMPDMGGVEAWEQLKVMRPQMRVLFASGYADGQHGFRLPPDVDLLAKPYLPEELLRRVRKKLDE